MSKKIGLIVYFSSWGSVVGDVWYNARKREMDFEVG